MARRTDDRSQSVESQAQWQFDTRVWGANELVHLL